MTSIASPTAQFLTSKKLRPPRTQDPREKRLPISRKGGLPSGVSAVTPGNTGAGALISGLRPPQRPDKPVTDPNALSGTITKENTLRNKRLGFGVRTPQISGKLGAGSSGGGSVSAERIKSRDTVGSIKDAFMAQLPQLQQAFRDDIEGLTTRTAAMGRTGSGMFNEETGFIGDRAIAAREALLGNLSFTATQNDANRALQAAQANQGAGLQAGIANQNFGMQNRQLDFNMANADAQRALQVDLARQSHLGQLQSREDRLAREAMMDRQFQMGLLQQGFSGAPTSAVGMGVNAGMAGANMYGSNAAQINASLANSGMQQGMMQGYQPPAPGPVQSQVPTMAQLPNYRPPVIERTQPVSTRNSPIGRPINVPSISPLLS